MTIPGEDFFVAPWGPVGDDRGGAYDDLDAHLSQPPPGGGARPRGRGLVARDLDLPGQDVEDMLDALAGELREDELSAGDDAAARRRRGALASADASVDDGDEPPPPLPIDDDEDGDDGGPGAMRFAPMDVDDDDPDDGRGRGGANPRAGSSTDTTGTAARALDVTRSSVAPSPAMLEMRDAERDRARRAVRPRRAAFRGARAKLHAFDAETHLGSDAYRAWLGDARDTALAGARPKIFHPERDLDDDALRRRFFRGMFEGFLHPRARDGAAGKIEAHFEATLEARREPRARRERREGRGKAHPEEEAAREAEALALEVSLDPEAIEAMEKEANRERRARIKRQLRGKRMGDVSSDDEGGYAFEPIAYAGDRYSQDSRDDDAPMPPMPDEEDEDDFRPRRASGDVFTPSSPSAFSLAAMLDGRAMDERDARNYSLAASMDVSGDAFRGSVGVGAFGGSAAPSSVGAPASGTLTEGLTQFQLLESEGIDDAAQSGRAMLAAARDASAGVVGQAAYNLLQFLSARVFVGHVVPPGTTGGGAVAAKSLRELCEENRLSKGKAAKCFYQCLVLVGAGFLEAAQDVRVPYGEILIRPGRGFSEPGGDARRAEEDDDEEEGSENDEPRPARPERPRRRG